jgi:hypothetical protein
VFVCGGAFERANPVREAALEIVVIHEMLHSLGLGENGQHPSSAAITRRVTMRCNH